MIFVTGGTGLVGSHLLFDLVKRGDRVRALKRTTADLEPVMRLFERYAPGSNLFKTIEWVDGDITDIFSMVEVLEGIERIYHCAALVSFEGADHKAMQRINVEGTANLVNAALERGIKKLCYVSSTAAIGRGKPGETVTETCVWNAKTAGSAYSKTKYFAEQEVWRASAEGLPVVMVNPALVIGPGAWGKSSTNLFLTAWRGLSFYTDGGNGYVDARDVSRAMVELMHSNIENQRFLLVSENLPFRDVFTIIANAFRKAPPKYRASRLLSSIAWRAAGVKSLFSGKPALITKETAAAAQRFVRYSNQKIKDAIGFEFLPVEQSLKETAALFLEDREQGIL